MPPLARLRIGALDDLARQLRFAPAETLRRQLERAEALAADIDPDLNYPEDWVVFRITGYRPETSDEPATLVGAALLAEMSALVERLSDAARLRWDDPRAGPTLDPAQLCERWNVSRKTLDRYRRRGLIARRVVGENGKPRLAFPLDAVERFEARERERIDRAAGFTRIDPDLEARMIRRASVYRRRAGCTLNGAALRLARRFGRSHEAVRQLLRRHDAAAETPIFSGPAPLTPRRRAAAWRALRRGIPPAKIARRYQRTRGSIIRAVNVERTRRLRELALHPPHAPADASVLAAPAATSGLGAPGETDLLRLIETARRAEPPPAPAERARVAAHHHLLARAAAAIAALSPDAPSGAALDAIETDLRWAARLKAELVRSQLALMVRTLEGILGRPPELVRGTTLLPLVEASIAAIADAAAALDPARGGRLAAPAGLAIQRAAAAWARAHSAELGRLPGRAAPALPSGIPIEDWTRRIAPWQLEPAAHGPPVRGWLEPDARVRAALPRLDADAAALLARRYGWDGAPPSTLAQLAQERGTTVMKVAEAERRAIRAALAHVRDDARPPDR